MRLNEIETRLSEIKGLLNSDADVNVEELETETTSLLEERKGILDSAETRQRLLDGLTNDETVEIVKPIEKENKNMENIFAPNTVEYRDLYFKHLLGKDLNEAEQRTYIHKTGVEDGLEVPETTLNQIWNLIGEKHPILGDITMYRANGNLKVQKHTAIVAGDAGKSTEAVAPTKEQNTFVTVTLVAETYAKLVEVSYELDWAVPHLEAYLVNEIADRLGGALADEIVSKVQSGMTAGNKKTSAAAKVVTYEELTALFGALKQAGRPVVYVTNGTLYNYLVSLVDTTGRPLFQPNFQAGAQGSLIGAQIKVEDSVPENVILVGDPKQIAGNLSKDIFIEQDRDIARGVNQYAGRAQFGCVLVNPNGFAQLTVKQS